ncbi:MULTISPECIES: acyl-CoA dehydrogenase family protein [unclassified Bartonella]|uniref:acyl-CoA dehydrogenase family protein n=1 Tax=unclassified Bartonella TaxID=2645622 RepID=UPI000998FED6|nr:MULTISPECIES: acyl-CoA dehydrogenase family protein [unclassified Bartonella]AQX28044.1 putative acyl-CoA dehydrogenase [Bartonella sp. JB15]AQX29319.1 putative acyl-CoA dehydrogenase [Bartonella sp. JB63]
MSVISTQNIHRKNAFLSDTLMFRIASTLPTSLLASFEEIGAFVASDEAWDLARLANSHRPTLRYNNEWGQSKEELDIHPSYHTLQRYSRQVGLVASLWENTTSENGVRYQARAIRLALLAGLETGHLNEITVASAAIAVLIGDVELFKKWQDMLLSRQYDLSSNPIDNKKGASLTYAFDNIEKSEKYALNVPPVQRISFDEKMGRDLYRLNIIKTKVINPIADGYIISAEIDGILSCFLVPRMQENGLLNGIILVRYLIQRSGEYSVPEGVVEFRDCCGWLLGNIGEGAKVIKDIETMMRFDQAIISAGVLRAALQLSINFLRQKMPNQPFPPLTERIFADIALDIAASQALVMRLARAFDNAANDRSEAAFARIMTPIVACHVSQLVIPIVGEIIAQVGIESFMDNNPLLQILRDSPARIVKNNGVNQLVKDAILIGDKAPGLFQQLLEKISADIGPAGPRAIEIIKSAVNMASTNEGAGRFFVEQMAYASATAALRYTEVEHVVNAYMESRLGGQWRSSYGMLIARYNPTQLLDVLYPTV